jgi:hypothetical protein
LKKKLPATCKVVSCRQREQYSPSVIRTSPQVWPYYPGNSKDSYREIKWDLRQCICHSGNFIWHHEEEGAWCQQRNVLMLLKSE